MLELLRQMDAASLDYTVRTAPFSQRFRSIGRRARRALTPFLTRERVADLSIEARAAVIDALQLGPNRTYKQEGIRDLFLATLGFDLTRLKRLIDRSLDHRDLVELVYRDLDPGPIRQAVLDHVQSQGRQHPCHEVKVISDVDDTFYRNWVDPRYPPRTVYPGVVQLYKELEGKEVGDIVFLTGRPGDPAGLLHSRFRRGLGRLGAPESSIITGSFHHQFYNPWIFSRKWRNFERYRALYPEMPIVMVGDSGQADPELIGHALERYPDHVRAGLIHRVKALSAERIKPGVFLFDTYVGAALRLLELGFLGPEAVERVASAAEADFQKIRFPTRAMQDARRAELDADLARVRDKAPAVSPGPRKVS